MGVKSLGCENRIAHPLPIHSWKRILPSVVSAVKSGALSPMPIMPVMSRSPSLRIDGALRCPEAIRRDAVALGIELVALGVIDVHAVDVERHRLAAGVVVQAVDRLARHRHDVARVDALAAGAPHVGIAGN